MKTILTLVGGGDRDRIILETALAAAVPLAAHLDVLHVHASATEAARYSNAEFASGAALRNTLQRLGSSAEAFSTRAAQNVREFCASARVEFCDTPGGVRGVTASFREAQSNALERLAVHARHSDLVVMGRARQTQGLAPVTLEHLVLNCGRPILVAATAAPDALTGTVMVCWNESPNAARALTAAAPLLAAAKRVVFAGAADRDDGGVAEALDDLARQFAWTARATEVRVIRASRRGAAAALSTAAADCAADLVVMGAYGRSRTRSLLSGSCTDALLEGSDRPMLLMH